MKIKTHIAIALAATLAVVGTVSYLPIKEGNYSVNIENSVLSINTEVTDKSMRAAVKLLKEATGHTVIDIKSFGGSVFDGRDLLLTIRSKGGQVDTYADNYFMSMGMGIFLEGNNRYVKHDVMGMIHRGSVGGLTYNGLKMAVEVLEAMGEELEPQSKLQLEGLRSALAMMDMSFAREFELLKKYQKTAPNPEATQKIIDSLMIGDRDIFLNAEQLLEAGLATEILDDTVLPDQLVE